MSETTRWWWVRHAPVDSHDGRIYGHDDLDADCSDRALFAGLAAQLPADPVWVASHLRRTQQTAAALGAPSPIIDPDLAEQNFGRWQGLSHDELRAARDGAWHRFWLAPAHETPPGGESFEEVVSRVGQAVVRLTAAHRGRDIVAVAHGGSIRAALALALGIDAERALAIAIDNCTLTRIDHIDGARSAGAAASGGVWRIVAVNLLPHGLPARWRAGA
jgi:broad specificity phosphatase PhoE